jgi:hypothetical protein
MHRFRFCTEAPLHPLAAPPERDIDTSTLSRGVFVWIASRQSDSRPLWILVVVGFLEAEIISFFSQSQIGPNHNSASERNTLHKGAIYTIPSWPPRLPWLRSPCSCSSTTTCIQTRWNPTWTTCERSCPPCLRSEGATCVARGPSTSCPRRDHRRRVALTPGCQIRYMEYTGCHRLMSSTIRPTKAVTLGCQTGNTRTILAVLD